MSEITKKQAIELSKSNFWESMSFHERAMFQLFETRLCMPWTIFHEAVEKTLGRGVFTHEFGMNLEGFRGEILGRDKAPSFEQIINMIPEEKRVIVIMGGDND